MELKASLVLRRRIRAWRRALRYHKKTCQSWLLGLFYRSPIKQRGIFSIRHGEGPRLFFVRPKRTHTFKKFIRPAITAAVLCAFLSYSIQGPTPTAYGATYTFVQSSWSGGTSSTTATHPSDSTGWNKFSTSTYAYSTATTTVSIASSTYTFTDDGTVSATGPGSGGGFGNGTHSNTVQLSSGSGASISLATSSGVYYASGNFISASMDLGVAEMTSISWSSTTPSGVGSNSIKFQLAANNDNSTWSYVGPDGTGSTYFTTNGTTSFPASFLGKEYWRYKLYLTTADTSVSPTLSDVTFTYTSYAHAQSVTVTDDTSLTTTGSASGGGFGDGSTASTTISGGSVSLVLSLVYEAHQISYLGKEQNGMNSNLVWPVGSTNVYYKTADNATEFKKIDTTNDTSSTVASTPSSMSGGALYLYASSTEDYIYAFHHSETTTARYSISGNTWQSLASAPDVPGYGPTLARAGDSFYMMAVASTSLWQYSINNNTWTKKQSSPIAPDLYHGANFFYAPYNRSVYEQVSQQSFSKYLVDANSWTEVTNPPTFIDPGALVVVTDGDPNVYYQGSSYTNTGIFYKYNTINDTWTKLASPTTTGVDLSDHSLFCGQHDVDSDYIYVVAGSDKLLRYQITNNTWTIIATLPYTVNDVASTYIACSMVRQPNGNIIYFASNASGDVFKDTINVNQYASTGTFRSASIDLGSVSSLTRIAWTSTTPSGVGNNAISFQIAMNNDNATWNYVGPDGTASTYFSTNGGTTFSSAQSGYRYLRYKVYLATSDTSVTPSLDSVTFTYNAYSAAANLTSNIYDSGDPTNVLASVAWSSYLPSGGTIQFQLRSGSSTTTVSSATWVGPDGTNSTYFTTYTGENTSSTMRTGSGNRYFQYKVFLSSTNFALTPVLSSATVTYVVNAPPEIRNVSVTPNNDGTITISYETRDSDTSTGTNSPGYITPSFQYCPGGANCQTVSNFASGNLTNKSVNDVTWSTYTATWTPKVELPNTYVANAVIKVTANDNEAANNTAYATSSAFTLDTISPTSTSFFIDASQSPAMLHFAATDTSSMRYRIAATSGGVNSASYSSFVATTTYATTSNPFTLYVQYADTYGNTTSVLSATTPEQPTGLMVQDTSNVNIAPVEIRLFVAWKATAGAFASYKVYRSLDQSTWTLIGTVTDAATNYFGDSTVSQGTVYYYRVNTVDGGGNISYNSAIISADPNGVQDQGEGGGGTPAAPVITNVTSTVGSTFATISWDTDTLSDSSVGYSITAGQFDTTSTVPSMVNNASGVGKHTVTITGLTPNTTYYFDVASADVSGRVSTSNNGGNGYSFTTQNGVTISNVSVNQIYNTSATVTWDTSAPADSYVVYSTASNLSGSASNGSISLTTNHSVTITGLTLGTTYYFYTQSTDGNGLLSEDKHVVNGTVVYYSFGTTNDTTGPTISSITSTPYATYATVGWRTNEVADSMIEYGTSTAYGTTTTLDSTLTIQHQMTLSSLLNATTYHYRIHTADANGNETVSTDQTLMTGLTPDTTAPTISAIATSSVSLVSAIIRWTTDEVSNATVDYGTNTGYGSIAGNVGDFSTTSHSVTITGLTGNLDYYFRVRSQDPSGNTALYDNAGQGYTFRTVADTTAPTITDVSAAVTGNRSAAITWRTDEDATSQVDYSTSTTFGPWSEATTTYDRNHLITLTGLTPSTTYYFRVRSADLSSNATLDDNSGALYTFETVGEATVTTIVLGGGGSSGSSSGLQTQDSVAPIISNVQVKDITRNSATVEWVTDENATTFVRYGDSFPYTGMNGSYSQYAQQHSVILNNLLSGTFYHYVVASQDKSGNVAETSDQTFATLNSDNTVVTTPPPTTTTPPTLTPEEQQQKQLADSVAQASKQSIQKILEALVNNPALPEISEDLFIKAVTEMASHIVEAPSIVGPQPQVVVDGTTAIVRWATDKKSSSQVLFARFDEYNKDTAHPYTNAAVAPGDLSLTHEVTITDLSPGTVYHFQVVSKGLIGPESRSADKTFVTTATPPKISDIAVSSPSETSVTVLWKTNVPTAATIEYLNTKTGAKLTQGDTSLLLSHALTLKNLIPGTQYRAVILAVDERGSQITSDAISFVTVLDVTAPVMSNVTADSSLFPGSNSKVQTIVSWDTNEPASSQVFFKEGSGMGGTVQTTTFENASTTKHVQVLTSFKPGTVYTYWVASQDLAGNATTSEKYTILTPQQKETIIDVMIKNFDQVFGWTKQISF